MNYIFCIVYIFSLSLKSCTVTLFYLDLIFDLTHGFGVWYEGPKLLDMCAEGIETVVLAMAAQHK